MELVSKRFTIFLQMVIAQSKAVLFSKPNVTENSRTDPIKKMMGVLEK